MVSVIKFGGASVKDANGIKNLNKIVKNHLSGQLLIVVSAMGKVTNLLADIAEKSWSGKNAELEIIDFKTFHHEICQELFRGIPSSINQLLNLFDKCVNDKGVDERGFTDKIIAFGELLSTRIVAEHLKIKWVDARDYIKTDSKFTEADVIWAETGELIQKNLPSILEKNIAITQGFIGSDLNGNVTTLGREGSDYSGAIFSNCLDAHSLTVYKDVPGLLNADPRIFPNAEKFDQISYQEVIEMTYYGAKVIHPKTIHPLAEKGIPLFVKSFINPAMRGTEISESDKVSNKTSFVFKEDQVLISVRVQDNSFMDELKMSVILNALHSHKIKANLIHNSALTFTFCMDDVTYKKNEIIKHLSMNFQVLYNEKLCLATIKNYEENSFEKLPDDIEKIIEEKSRNNYQVVYRVIKGCI